MNKSILFNLLLSISFLLPPPILSQTSSSSTTQCPLDFSIAKPYISAAASSPPSNLCSFSLQILHLVESQYLLTSNLFLPPPSSSSSCWSSLSHSLSPHFSLSLPSSCNFSTPSISLPCNNITSLSSFQSTLSPQALSDLNSSCNNLLTSSICTSCTITINRIKTSFLSFPDISNVTDCNSYPFIYAAATNRFGPADPSTASCLFLLQRPSSSSSSSSPALPAGIAAGAAAILLIATLSSIWYFRYRRRRRRTKWTRDLNKPHGKNNPEIGASTNLIKLSYDDIRSATRNFSRDNMIGSGGYGNVYRGVLNDGSAVAVKRFKNCSAAGDAAFAHEVEVIASVRHVNLVSLRGYCTATTPLEGHQRIIVCDLITNGSLHDHLFSAPGGRGGKLSWPARQRIAVGTARGLAYLHHGVQPAIIHRDIKGSNILLDDNFDAMVADFGLAKFAPEGASHVSTRVAGTLGYVAPEYALFGQLTEKSDVYSYGVVLLELLSGKKAFRATGDGENWLLTDWAWSMVREGRPLEVIEEGMEEKGSNDVLERYVLVAVLCSHPQLHARPTMDQVVKILESDVAIPTIPDRPLSFVANREEIEKSMSSSSSGQLVSPSGYNPYMLTRDGTLSQGSEIL